MNGGGSPLHPPPPASGDADLYPSRPAMRRRGSFRNVAAKSSPPFSRSGAVPSPPGIFSDDEPPDEEIDPHFLDHCFLCKKHLGAGNDIFMYRGDTPFCSEECRQEQIEIDEEKKKREKMKHQKITMKHKDQQQRSSPPTIYVRAAAG